MWPHDGNMNAQRWILPGSLAAGVLIGLAIFGDTIRWLVASWLNDPNYSHGILVPFIAAYFVWRARAALQMGTSNNFGLVLLAVALALHLAAIPMRIYPLSAFALVLSLASVVVLFRGLPALRASGYAIAVLCCMLPLPLADQLSPSLE